jgi:hypothetical protein
LFSKKSNIIQGPLWSWSYGSWIYNYLCNQCISPLKLWVWIPHMVRCTRCNIMWWSLSVTCGKSVVSPGTLVSFTNKTDSHDIAEILLKVALNTMTLTLKYHSTNVGFLITVTMLEGILRKRKIIMEKKNNKVQILIRKIINANNMNSYKKLYIILMNISTMFKDIFRFFKGYSINNSITNCCSSMVKSSHCLILIFA